MNSRGKGLFGAIGAIVVAWSALQLFLTHRLSAAFFHESVAHCAEMKERLPASRCYPLAAVRLGDWLPYAVTSIVVLLALSAVAAMLVRGGYRWWSAVVIALPAANLYSGGREVSRFLGPGWVQLSDRQLTTWLFTGAVVDTFVITAVAVAMMLAVRPTARGLGSTVQLLRCAPPMIVLGGWWLMRHPLPERLDEIWLLQALAFVVAAALLATSALHLWTRAVGVLLVLPLCGIPIYSEATGPGSFLGAMLHHAAFAGATGVMVVGLPKLLAMFRDRSVRPTAVVVTPAG